MVKKLTVLLLAIFALGGTVTAYSWWDTLQETQSETLTIGEGTDLTLNAVATAPAGKVLVPAGVVMKANDVDSITLTYNVKLDQTVLSDLTLDVVASNVLVGGAAANAGLVDINITHAGAVNGSDVLVTVVVTLNEPADEATYNAVINEAITFDLTFTAINN